MKQVLVIGAGKSTGVLIEYLLSEAERHDWSIKVVDQSVSAARRRIGDHSRGTAESLDACDGPQRDKLVSASDLVVSMLPAHLQGPVTQACLQFRRHLVSASYVSPEVQELAAAAVSIRVPSKSNNTAFNSLGRLMRVCSRVPCSSPIRLLGRVGNAW